MPATKRLMNWSGLTFTPTGGSAINLTGVSNVQVALNGSIQKFSGDYDKFPTTVIADFADPLFTITTADIAAALSIYGLRGALVAVQRDAKNGTGSGAITYTVSGAVVMDVDTGGQHRQFGQATIKICTESSDGATNPVATSVAA